MTRRPRPSAIVSTGRLRHVHRRQMAAWPRQRPAAPISDSIILLWQHIGGRRGTRIPASKSTAGGGFHERRVRARHRERFRARFHRRRTRTGHSLFYYPMILTHAPYQPTPDSSDWDPEATDERPGQDGKHFADMVPMPTNWLADLCRRLEERTSATTRSSCFSATTARGRASTRGWVARSYAGGKGSTNARGMHVPLIANWPGTIPAGQVNRRPHR